ncbi:hypothetical protein ACFL67_03935 [candidate division KSB1 bacterium]
MNSNRYLLPAFNIFMKILNIVLLLLPLWFPDWPQFQGKAMGARLVMYPTAGFVVPLIWLCMRRRAKYPHLVDILVVLPFVIDSSGNALNLYNTTAHFDRFAHCFNWISLTAAFGSAVSVLRITRLNAASLAVGFGAVTHILWEISEYIIMNLGSIGLQLTYVDTLEDLILSFLGTVIGAILVVTIFWRGKLMPKQNSMPGNGS